MKFSTPAVIRHGKLALDDRRFWDECVQHFGDGEVVTLTVETEQSHRTNAQNRFFHGPVLNAFRELGYHKQEAKDMLALRFIPQEIKLLDGSIVRVPGHTSALSKKDFTEFIEACIQLAAEQGIVIEDVEDYHRLTRGVVA